MRIALITGASGVIGGACAKALDEKGYALVLQYHDHPERAQALVKTLPEDTPVLLCHADITRVSEAEMDRLYSVNVKGAMLLTKGAIPHMLKKEGGAIVHLSSMWGLTGGACEAVYSASKGALNGFVKAMAKELAPSHIRVNAVAPGLVPSPMNASLNEEDLIVFQEETPLGKLITPEQVADAVCYLAEAEMVTGQILSVDGGIVI